MAVYRAYLRSTFDAGALNAGSLDWGRDMTSGTLFDHQSRVTSQPWSLLVPHFLPDTLIMLFDQSHGVSYEGRGTEMSEKATSNCRIYHQGRRRQTILCVVVKYHRL